MIVGAVQALDHFAIEMFVVMSHNSKKKNGTVVEKVLYENGFKFQFWFGWIVPNEM